MANVSMAELEDLSWVETVRRFVKETPTLTDKDLPQLKALLEIARTLDRGGKQQAATIAQFTLIQRTLAGKTAPADPSMPPPLPGLEGMGWAPSKPDAGDYGGA